MTKTLLEEMSWPEAKSAFAEGRVVLVPVGSTEQHGPHLPLGTDSFTAQALAARVGRRTGALVTPTLPFGYAEYHTDFAGTLSLSNETYTRVLIELVDRLVRYGATHILFVNGHGGNAFALSQVGLHLRELGVVVGMVQWWDITGKLRPEWGFGHGDLTETSLMLALTPDLVDMSAATAPQETAPAPQLIPVTPWDFVWENGVVHVYLRTQDVSARGDLKEESGKPPQAATRAFGDEIVALVIDYLCGFVELFRTIRLRPGPARE
ncbi:MAG TPA: creatininase family protein [bacterium]|nr:creatininase family protein [bacterium]